MGAAQATARRGAADVGEGELLWTPSRERVARSNLTAFTRWIDDERGLNFADYTALWGWSVADLEGFWGAVWDYFDVVAHQPPSRVLAAREMPGAEWFPDAELNYAEHVLRHERAGADALLHAGERTALVGVPWEVLGAQVRTLATQLRELGVAPGDRVVAFVPNIPEAVVALLATASVGAVWACCSPDFGAAGALDRFAQLEPTVLLAADGYVYGGTAYDRRDHVREIAAGLGSLEHVVHLDHLATGSEPPVAGALRWRELLAGPEVAPEQFAFEPVAFDHPLWVLFSSGATGPPKPLVHGHGGILVEQLKLQHLHMDLSAGDRTFFFTTTGWMMWNFLVSALLLDVQPVLYDGHPTHPRPDRLWELAQDARVSLFGASPAYVDAMDRTGVVPGERYDLSALREILPAGAPVSPAHTAWFHENVDADVWVATGSGGTDCCTGFVGGVPTLPVYAGEIQARSLGVAAHAFNDRGESVVGGVGELVITEPMPSMPVFLWGDRGHARYRETYFADYPGVWRHGDFFKVNERGGCVVLGRSDATLNRHGVRIGTAEIYRVVEPLPEIEEALAVDVGGAGGAPSETVLFVVLSEGGGLDDELAGRLRQRLRERGSPRHVPDRIVAAPAIPRTLTGKKLEVPVRRILSGAPAESAANRAAVANPDALDFFIRYAEEGRAASASA